MPEVPANAPEATVSVPAETSVAPVKSLAAVSVRLPVPSFVKAPAPVILLAKVRSSLRLMANVPALVMSPAATEPDVPPLPSCSVPAEIVVPPPKVLAPVRMSVPGPDLVSEPLAPEITPPYVPPDTVRAVVPRAMLPPLSAVIAAVEPSTVTVPPESVPMLALLAKRVLPAPPRLVSVTVPVAALKSSASAAVFAWVTAPRETPAPLKAAVEEALSVRAAEPVPVVAVSAVPARVSVPPLTFVTAPVAAVRLTVPEVRVVIVATPPIEVVPPSTVVTVAAPVIVLVPPVTEAALRAPVTLTTPPEIPPVTVASEPKVVLPAPESEASVMMPVGAVKFSAFASVALALLTAPTF